MPLRFSVSDHGFIDVKSTPEGAIAGDAAGVGHATSGSATDQLTRQHRMTLDEASLILNVKKDSPLEQILKVRFQPPYACLYLLKLCLPELRASLQSQLSAA
jgi:hypothetical protein